MLARSRLAVSLVAAVVLAQLVAVAAAQEQPTIASYTTWVTGLAFSPDGNTLASVGGQTLLYRPGDIKLWDPNSGQLKASY
ncbi:MAG TPA: hypothetical protein PK867_02620, partial [Pirellulales bacterium]|nr:hypothetical protein [Pirellulales bacterium]